LLVISESFHPWWTAELDGASHPVLRAQVAFLGAMIPAGDHVLELKFRRPWTFVFLAAVSLVSLFAVLGALGVTFRRRRPAPEEGIPTYQARRTRRTLE